MVGLLAACGPTTDTIPFDIPLDAPRPPVSTQQDTLTLNAPTSQTLGDSEVHQWQIVPPDEVEALAVNFQSDGWLGLVTLQDNSGQVLHSGQWMQDTLMLNADAPAYTLTVAERYGGGAYSLQVDSVLPPTPTSPPIPTPTAGPSPTPPPNEALLGTGDVQVTLRWDTTDDLDLYVVDPSGDTIYYADRTSSSGGELDIDANPGCRNLVQNPVENVFWPPDNSPSGDYEVRVRLFSYCEDEVRDIPFTVRLRIEGLPEQVVQEVMPPSSGTVITIFEFTKD